jgi:sialic acid synthase SpsE
VKIQDFDLDQKVFVVAEIGNNHEGSFSLAEELVGRAAEAGADAVKFQTIVPNRLVHCADKDRLEKLKQFQLSDDQFRQLAALASRLGVVFFSTAFDVETARFLDTIQQVHKISSGDNNFIALIETVAAFGKPMMLSTGLSGVEGLRDASERIFGVWKQHGVAPGLCMQHCVSSYPTPHDEANLNAIPTMAKLFPEVTVGYSDHTLGIEAAIYSVAAGARVVEKHFTVDKNHSDFRDHALSADPAEMRQLVSSIRSLETLLGGGSLAPRECEQSLQVGARRSIAAAADLPAGTVLSHGDLTWLRPGTGLPPGSEEALVGRTMRRSVAAGELISLNDFVEMSSPEFAGNSEGTVA